MTDRRPAWFAPKRYGYGAGLPIAWQGWAISIGFAAVMVGLALLLHDRPAQLVAAMILPLVVLIVVSARTTRGGWRWRWGGDDADSADR
jgi:hypothetical protein